MKLYYILDANRQKVGPYTDQELAAAYYQGAYGSSTLAWCQGMKEWTPLNAIFEEIPPVPVPDVPPPPPSRESVPCRSATRPASPDKQYYITRPDGTRVGPVPQNELCAGYVAGLYGAGTYVWSGGMPEWKPLEELFPSLTAQKKALDHSRVSAPVYNESCRGATHPPCGAMKPVFSMNPIFVLKHAYTHITFAGRATRKEFWTCILWFSILCKIIGVILNGISAWAVLTYNTPLLIIIIGISFIVTVAVLVPLTAVTGRRLHDLGWSACLALYIVFPAVFCWFAVLVDLLLFAFAGISLIFSLVLMLLLIKDSQRGTNEYGPSEKYPDAHHAR